MLVESRQQFEAARTILIDAERIAVDTETTGYYVHQGHKLCGISVFAELAGMKGYGAGFYFPFRHKAGEDLFSVGDNLPEEWMRELAVPLSDPEKTLIFHNAKFDLGFLRREGIEVNGTVADTVVMSHLWDENGSHALKNLSAKLFGESAKNEQEEIKKLLRKAKTFDAIPARLMEPYAVKDAELTHKLYEHFLPLLEQEGLIPVLEREMRFTRCLFEMEWAGVAIDLDLARTLADGAMQRMRQIEDLLGFDPLKLDRLARKLFSAPPDGLGLIPGPLTNSPTRDFPRGRPMMDEAVLSTYDDPVVSLVLEYRGLVKANSTWYTGFQQKAMMDGRLHATFNQCGTKTGRLSCSNPNLQQLPRNVEDTPVRRLLQAPGEWELWEFDYAQIEFRLGAVYAECSPLLEIFRSGADIFTQMAGELNLDRQTTKMVVYLTLYGGGARNLAQRLGCEQDVAKSILDNFHETYPGFRELARKAEMAARNRGWVQTWAGRRRHIVEEWEYHKAFNSIIQGGAGDIVKETMLMFHEDPMPEFFRMVSQVHDSLLFEVKSSHTEASIPVIRRVMEWPEEKFGIPFPVDAKLMK